MSKELSFLTKILLGIGVLAILLVIAGLTPSRVAAQAPTSFLCIAGHPDTPGGEQGMCVTIDVVNQCNVNQVPVYQQTSPNPPIHSDLPTGTPYWFAVYRADMSQPGPHSQFRIPEAISVGQSPGQLVNWPRALNLEGDDLEQKHLAASVPFTWTVHYQYENPLGGFGAPTDQLSGQGVEAGTNFFISDYGFVFADPPIRTIKHIGVVLCPDDLEQIEINFSNTSEVPVVVNPQLTVNPGATATRQTGYAGEGIRQNVTGIFGQPMPTEVAANVSWQMCQPAPIGCWGESEEGLTVLNANTEILRNVPTGAEVMVEYVLGGDTGDTEQTFMATGIDEEGQPIVGGEVQYFWRPEGSTGDHLPLQTLQTGSTDAMSIELDSIRYDSPTGYTNNCYVDTQDNHVVNFENPGEMNPFNITCPKETTQTFTVVMVDEQEDAQPLVGNPRNYQWQVPPINPNDWQTRGAGQVNSTPAMQIQFNPSGYSTPAGYTSACSLINEAGPQMVTLNAGAHKTIYVECARVGTVNVANQCAVPINYTLTRVGADGFVLPYDLSPNSTRPHLNMRLGTYALTLNSAPSNATILPAGTQALATRGGQIAFVVTCAQEPEWTPVHVRGWDSGMVGQAGGRLAGIGYWLYSQEGGVVIPANPDTGVTGASGYVSHTALTSGTVYFDNLSAPSGYENCRVHYSGGFAPIGPPWPVAVIVGEQQQNDVDLVCDPVGVPGTVELQVHGNYAGGSTSWHADEPLYVNGGASGEVTSLGLRWRTQGVVGVCTASSAPIAVAGWTGAFLIP